jgi:chaperonin GroEL
MSDMDKIRKGIVKAADFVAKTAGPNGKNIIFSNSADAIATKDGVSVIRNFRLDDPAEMAGVHLVRQACERQLVEYGDGTTATAVIMGSFVSRSYSRGDIVKIDEAIESLDLSPVRTIVNLMYVAMVASNGNKEVSDSVVEAVQKCGIDGRYICEQSWNTGIQIEYANGFDWNAGYIDPVFANINGAAVLNNPVVLLMKNYGTEKETIEKIQSAVSAGRPVLIVGNPDYDILGAIAQWHREKKAQFCLVNIPGAGHIKDDFAADLQALIDSGGIRQAIVRAHSASIKHDGDMSDYIAKLESAEVASGAEGDERKDRIARLTGKVAVIKIGSDTNAGLRVLADCVDDTIKSCVSAIRHGVVEGGGWALAKAARGIKIPALKLAMTAPVRNLHWKIVGPRIIDSAGVVKGALKNAWEGAKQFINASGLIILEGEQNG